MPFSQKQYISHRWKKNGCGLFSCKFQLDQTFFFLSLSLAKSSLALRMSNDPRDICPHPASRRVCIRRLSLSLYWIRELSRVSFTMYVLWFNGKSWPKRKKKRLRENEQFYSFIQFLIYRHGERKCLSFRRSSFLGMMMTGAFVDVDICDVIWCSVTFFFLLGLRDLHMVFPEFFFVLVGSFDAIVCNGNFSEKAKFSWKWYKYLWCRFTWVGRSYITMKPSKVQVGERHIAQRSNWKETRKLGMVRPSKWKINLIKERQVFELFILESVFTFSFRAERAEKWRLLSPRLFIISGSTIKTQLSFNSRKKSIARLLSFLTAISASRKWDVAERKKNQFVCRWMFTWRNWRHHNVILCERFAGWRACLS